MAEAGLLPVASRRLGLAAHFLAKAKTLPRSDPFRQVADDKVPARLTSVTGRRQVGLELWEAAGQPVLPRRAPSWVDAGGATL